MKSSLYIPHFCYDPTENIATMVNSCFLLKVNIKKIYWNSSWNNFLLSTNDVSEVIYRNSAFCQNIAFLVSDWLKLLKILFRKNCVRWLWTMMYVMSLQWYLISFWFGNVLFHSSIDVCEVIYIYSSFRLDPAKNMPAKANSFFSNWLKLLEYFSMELLELIGTKLWRNDVCEVE
jgi:hypothetical protein